MSIPKPEIAPEVELVEDDDEQSLPQADEADAPPSSNTPSSRRRGPASIA
jgi:hypothetical protein